jgi:hypothetical protein
MSATTTTEPPAPVASTPGMLDHFFTAAEHAANLIYHRALTFEADVSKWTADNEVLKPLITEGVTFLEAVLTAHGVPVPALVSAGTAVMAALGKLAQSDTTVVSGTTTASVALPVSAATP